MFGRLGTDRPTIDVTMTPLAETVGGSSNIIRPVVSRIAGREPGEIRVVEGHHGSYNFV